ncbi:uncharacterized protein LOC119081819 [Bradysia coprophila]|uniref:uncharacterized protein LOC119081819 n=1 Tax=Bradysia coprophila TaxID=38358 RepID=UPI00187DAA34|nr:uncharacterized protein LOC119081819 [Bradysia coprophila]
MLLKLCPIRVDRLLLKFNNLPLTRKTITTTPIRSDMFNIGKRMKNEQRFKTMDKIDPNFELIYRAPFEYMTAFCQHVPAISLLSISSVYAYKLANGMHAIEPDAQLVLGPYMSDGSDLIVLCAAFYVMNLSLLYFVRKYPLRIYKSDKEYRAIFEGFLPLRPRQWSFKQGDMSKAKSILPWHECIYKIKDKKVLVFSHHFKKPIHFNDMLHK